MIVKAYYGGPLVGMRYPLLKSICHILIAESISILRNDKLIRPQGSTIIEAGDEITFICATEHIKAVMSELQRLEKTYKRIMIVGSGNIASGVAKQLEDKYQVKLIERDGEKAKVLAEKLSKTLVSMAMLLTRIYFLKSILRTSMSFYH